MYADRRLEIAGAYGLLGAVADQVSWPGTPWSPATSVWSAVCGADVGGVNQEERSAADVSARETGLDGTTVGGPPSSPAAVAPQGRGHPPCHARGAVEPGLAREGAVR